MEFIKSINEFSEYMYNLIEGNKGKSVLKSIVLIYGLMLGLVGIGLLGTLVSTVFIPFLLVKKLLK